MDSAFLGATPWGFCASLLHIIKDHQIMMSANRPAKMNQLVLVSHSQIILLSSPIIVSCTEIFLRSWLLIGLILVLGKVVTNLIMGLKNSKFNYQTGDQAFNVSNVRIKEAKIKVSSIFLSIYVIYI